ncbi:hypothetical protein BDZ88DRAFT_435171 [Geranomyces variabilis]|nr:hypothetical protein BDZ88DRAFT_435171 [Geranomyces variabilis]
MPVVTTWPQIDENFTLPELKDACRDLGLPVSGTKREVGFRLRPYTIRQIRNACNRECTGCTQIARPPSRACTGCIQIARLPSRAHGGASRLVENVSFPGLPNVKRTLTFRKDGGLQRTYTIKTSGGSTTVSQRQGPRQHFGGNLLALLAEQGRGDTAGIDGHRAVAYDHHLERYRAVEFSDGSHCTGRGNCMCPACRFREL